MSVAILGHVHVSNPVNHANDRFTTEDVPVGDVVIPAGEPVLPATSSVQLVVSDFVAGFSQRGWLTPVLGAYQRDSSDLTSAWSAW
jgi:hypothetical protein